MLTTLCSQVAKQQKRIRWKTPTTIFLGTVAKSTVCNIQKKKTYQIGLQNRFQRRW
jgi:hypothetical protein